MIPSPRFHDTRHAYASHLLAAGMTSHVVAQLLGHSDAGLVERRYGHALPDEIAAVGDLLSMFRQQRAAQIGAGLTHRSDSLGKALQISR